MNKSFFYLKEIGYLFSVLTIIAFWGCGGGSSAGGSEDVAGKDIIIRDILIPADSTVQDIQNDIESKDVIIDTGDTSEDIEADSEVGSDITDTFEDVSDAQGDNIEDILTDISDVVEDVVVDGGCKDECTVSICKDNYVLNSCGDWDNDGCKEYKEVMCEKGCENGACKTCIPNCANKECGDDGCGGSCGSCGDNAVCRLNVCECKSGFGNCNDTWVDGCEVNFSTDPHHCSDCATDCGDNSVCNNKVCSCQPGYGNCDGLWSNGCEKNLIDDLNNCGSCGNSCGANGICVNSKCECISPYLNCNGLLSDGCEVNTSEDANNCGGCGNRCGPNAVCKNGVCECILGYANCDNDWDNGCEVNLNSINSCGTNCSNKVVCSSTNGTNPVCDNGVCRLTCNSGYADCNFGTGSSDGCEVNLNSQLTCGTSCGNIVNCGANTVCNSGSCGCISGYYNCNGSLSDGCEKQGDPKHIWSKRFGGIIDDISTTVFVDSSNNVYIMGWFNSPSIDFGGGALTNVNTGRADIFLAKFDSNGNHIWSKRFGGNGDDKGYSIYVDRSGNVYITGSFTSPSIDFGGGALSNVYAGQDDIFLAKFDKDGNHLWSKSFGGGASDRGNSIFVDSSGNVYITGYFASYTIDFGGGALTNANAGYSDIFLAKFDGNGSHIWSKSFGGNENDRGKSMYIDSLDNVYITGSFGSSTIQFGGNILTNVGSDDIFLAKFDGNGIHKWSKSFGGSSYDYVNSISVDLFGMVYITGNFGSSVIDFGGGALRNNGYSDIFIAQFDTTGHHLWSKGFGGNGVDVGYSVTVDSSSNAYITGWFSSPEINFGGNALINNGKYDIFLAKFDIYGNHLWSKNIGGSDEDWGYSVSVNGSSILYGTGHFQRSNIDFGGCPLSSAGGYDIYLIKYAP